MRCTGSRRPRRHLQVLPLQALASSKNSLFALIMWTALYSELYCRELITSHCKRDVQGAVTLEGTALKLALYVYLTYVDCIVFGTIFSGTPDKSLQLCCAGSRQLRRYRQVLPLKALNPSKHSLFTSLTWTDCSVFGIVFLGTPDESLQLRGAGSTQSRRHPP